MSGFQLILALVVTGGYLVHLLLERAPPPGDPAPSGGDPGSEAVEVLGPRTIRLRQGGPFDAKLARVNVSAVRLTNPLITVTGRVAASLRPTRGKGSDFWHFDSTEVLTAYTDWQKAKADITFAETHLLQVQQLAAARLEAQKQVVARLEKLVTAGTDTVKDLAMERANLIQVEITGNKDRHEAESALRVARRVEAAADRVLQQFGIDPDTPTTANSDIDIVLADVPEGKLDKVRVGQGCHAVFFGLPNQTFTGKVKNIAPVLSRERRALRVLFTIDDPMDLLRPGMFAEIGLGTDPREALTVPADGILHVDRADYAVVSAGGENWRVAEVQVGEQLRGDVEILHGLRPGETVIGKGAILLKPVLVKALRFPSPSGQQKVPPPVPKNSSPRGPLGQGVAARSQTINQTARDLTPPAGKSR